MTFIDFCGEDGDLMANNLLMLVKLDTDTMAFTSLLVSVVGAVAAIFAAFYANIAASYAKKAATYAKKAATEDDLAGVKQNTQQVEHFSNKILSIDTSIHPQEEQEAPQVRSQQEATQVQPRQEASPAQPEQKTPEVQLEASQPQPERISISVEGEAMGEAPLELFLTLQDSSVRVSRVERLGKAGKTLGSSPCKATDNFLVFKSILAPEKVRQWWDAGESTSEGEALSVLRVYLLLDESRREVHCDIPVSIVEGLQNVGITSLVVWTVKGSI